MGTQKIDPMTLNDRELKIYQMGHENGVKMGLNLAEFLAEVDRLGEVSP